MEPLCIAIRQPEDVNNSSRIAYHVAVHLLRNNLSRLVIAARSVDRGKKAKATMLSEVSAYKGCIEIWSLDMADFGSCRAFARRVNCELDRIDIFLANAGTYPVTWKLTKDGYEERYLNLFFLVP